MDVIEQARRQWVEHGWKEAAPGVEAVLGLVRVHQIFLARIERELRPYGLSFARFEILRLLAFSQSGSMEITRLSRLLQVHSTSVTSGVERLDAQGLVVRIREDRDRRRVRASLTSPGREVVERATKRLDASVFVNLGLTERELDTLLATLKAFRANAGDF